LCISAVGLALIYWARFFSFSYNAWTTKFRERHPGISRPPTVAMRELNTKIMANVFRLAGLILVLLAVYIFVFWKNAS